MPVTQVRQTDESFAHSEQLPIVASKLMNDRLYLKKGCYFNSPLVNEMVGMPVGIQIVGKKWEEEKVLAMMKVVEEALHLHQTE
jgi:hypothetical protein